MKIFFSSNLISQYIVMTFLTENSVPKLIIGANAGGVLSPSHDFTTTNKGKCVYFLRTKPVAITVDNMRQVCV